MNIINIQECKFKNPIHFVKFSKDLIDGYVCIKNGCGRFDTTCENCNWNTRTPYIIINNVRYVLSYPIMGWKTTGFNEDESFYIIVENFDNNDRVSFISEEVFKNTFVAE